MKLSFPLVLTVAAAHPFSAYALDCAKASQPLEKLFCATPELKKADEAMSAAYFKLLRETADLDFHEALIRSQRRWVEVRSHGVDRFGLAENPDAQTDDRKVLLQMTRDRLTFLQTAEPIRRMKEQQKIASKDSGDPFAGYQPADCFFVPPPYGNWNYLCLGTIHRQHDDRICSLTTSWAPGHTYEYRFVSVLKNGKPEPVATCTAYLSKMDERCPEPDDDDETKALSHWNMNPKPSGAYLPAPHPGALWKYDPDLEPGQTGQPWMNDCLSASTYPPPEVRGANSPPGK